MILDDEIQQVRGSNLRSRIQGFAAESLLYGSQNAFELVISFAAEKARGFSAARE